MFGRRKRIAVMYPERFVAAYSTHPFLEERAQARYPDYSFHKLDGMYWCVRVGDIEIPWGFGRHTAPFCASGTVTVSRRNVSAATFDGRGLPCTQVGDVHYFFEGRHRGEDGFVEVMRDKIIPAITEVATALGLDGFRNGVAEALGAHRSLAALLDEHQLELKAVTVETLSAD